MDSGPGKIQPIAPTHTLPPYPSQSSKLGEQGKTQLLVGLGEDGAPQSVSVTIPSGFPRLDDSAQSYVLAHWRWLPPPRQCLTDVDVVWNIKGGNMPEAPTPPVMSVPWEASLHANGAPTYDITFETPPGTGDMQPRISLHYESHADDNFIGPGWSLLNFLAVAHCPHIPTALCIGDSRLVAIRGAYGADGTEYRMHFQDFTRTISHGGRNGEPEWFEVSTKDGNTYQLGRTPESREIDPATGKIRAWRVNAVADPLDTYYVTHWEVDDATGILHPLRVDYTGNRKTQLQPYNSVRFVYDRAPVRLRHIQAFIGDGLVTDYRLDYEEGDVAGPSHLKTVARCDAQAQCLAPITLHWRDFETASGKLMLPTELDGGIGRHAFFIYGPAPKAAGTPPPSYPALVVSRLDFTNGSKRAGTTFSYGGEPFYNEYGDMAGFSINTRVEDETGVKIIVSYSTQPETLGKVTGEVWSLNGVTERVLRSDWAFRTDQPDVIFPYVAKDGEQDTDLDGTPMSGQEATHAYDEFGDETREETHWTDGSSKLDEKTYYSDERRWHLGRLLTMHVTREPAAPGLDRDSSFQYDPQTGFLTQEVIEPNLKPYRLATDYINDDYGHRIQKSTRGVDIPDLVSKTEYDRSGLFITTVTNEDGSRETRVTDPLTGFNTSNSSSKNIQKRSYDGFGRLLQYSDSQGTVINLRYGYCNDATERAPCPENAAYYADRTTSDPDDHLIAYFNSHGLVVAMQAVFKDNRSTIETRRYDIRDNLIQDCQIRGTAKACRTWSYDPFKRLTRQTWPDAEVTWTYHGLTETRTDPSGNTLSLTKDSQGRIVSQTTKDAHGERTAKFTYDAWGNLVETVDVNGRVTKSIYDVRGLMASEIEPDGTIHHSHHNVLGQEID